MKVAVVTGGNKGIGFATVKALCQKFDGDVYLTARDVARGQSAVKELQKLGLKPKFHQLDVDDEESISKFRDYLKKEYGGLDILVNNAGVAFIQPGVKDDHFEEHELQTLNTNYFGLLKVCHALFPLLRPHARVVNLSSSVGHLSVIKGEELRKRFADPNITEQEVTNLMNEFAESVKRGDQKELGWTVAYCVSKVGLCAVSFAQQREFNKDSRPDIVVNSVHPGFVDTDLTNHRGPLTIEQGAEAPVYLALLPPNVKAPRGEFVWFDKQIVDWVNGPTPTPIPY